MNSPPAEDQWFVVWVQALYPRGIVPYVEKERFYISGLSKNEALNKLYGFMNRKWGYDRDVVEEFLLPRVFTSRPEEVKTQPEWVIN